MKRSGFFLLFLGNESRFLYREDFENCLETDRLLCEQIPFGKYRQYAANQALKDINTKLGVVLAGR